MKRILLQTIPLIAWGTLFLFSCRQDIGHNKQRQQPTALIPIGVDWSALDALPQNVTVLFYNESDGSLAAEHVYEHNAQPIQSYAEVPVGTYTVVVFNEKRDQIDYVGIRGHENLATLEAYAHPNLTARARSVAGQYVNHPDMLAASVVRGVEVTSDMVDYTRARKSASRASDPLLDKAVGMLTGLSAESKVHQMSITLQVAGLNNARMPASADLLNMADSYSFDRNVNSMTPAHHQFTMNNRTYLPGSTTDGVISATITTFGVLGEKHTAADQPAELPIVLDVLFMLVDAKRTVVRQTIDATEQLAFAEHPSGAHTLILDATASDPLPQVVPENATAGSGFGTDLIDWDVVDIPLTAK